MPTTTSAAEHPAASRPGYVIGHITVRDPGKWRDYCAAVPASLAPWRAEIVFRGQRHAVFHGSHDHQLTVVIRFPDIAAATQWHASPAYQTLVPLRNAAADVTLLGFDT